MNTFQSNGQKELAFLAAHRPGDTAQNYTLAYITLNEPSSKMASSVKAIANDGIRIRQEEADEIVAIYAGDSIRHPAVDNSASQQRLQQHAAQLGDLSAGAAAQSKDFARDLRTEAEALNTEAARTVQIVTRMIERSQQAEDSFRTAARSLADFAKIVERLDARQASFVGGPVPLGYKVIEHKLIVVSEEAEVARSCDAMSRRDRRQRCWSSSTPKPFAPRYKYDPVARIVPAFLIPPHLRQLACLSLLAAWHVAFSA